MISQQMEEYLEAIGRLEERGEPVTTSALARECKVAPPTVTEMLHRLTDQGLIDYAPRQGASLTEAGRALSSSVIRRHRLWERFLHDILGLRWDQVHDQACQLEHATSPDLERRLAQQVGGSDTCPHGHTIPRSGQPDARRAAVPLATLATAQAARIFEVQEEAGLLRHLAALGIRPGALVQVEAVAPGDGTLTLMVDGQRHTLERAAAAQVSATPLSPEEAQAARAAGEQLALGDLAPGNLATVHEIRAGRGLVARCLALGFTPGAAVQMVQNLQGGPVIVMVRDTRVALGRREAQKIIVARSTGHGQAHESH